MSGQPHQAIHPQQQQKPASKPNLGIAGNANGGHPAASKTLSAEQREKAKEDILRTAQSFFAASKPTTDPLAEAPKE
jgi:hypothetical protein